MLFLTNDVMPFYFKDGSMFLNFRLNSSEQSRPTGEGTLMIQRALESCTLRDFVLENVDNEFSKIGEILTFYPNGNDCRDKSLKRFHKEGFGHYLYKLMEDRCFDMGVEMIISASERKYYIDFLRRRNFFFVDDYGKIVGYKFLR